MGLFIKDFKSFILGLVIGGTIVYLTANNITKYGTVVTFTGIYWLVIIGLTLWCIMITWDYWLDNIFPKLIKNKNNQEE